MASLTTPEQELHLWRIVAGNGTLLMPTEQLALVTLQGFSIVERYREEGRKRIMFLAY